MKPSLCIFFALAALCFLAPSQSLAATIGRITSNNLGLIGYWTFDGPDLLQNAKDRSGQGNTGYLQGFTSTTTVSGKIGQALKFDGSNDYVTPSNVFNSTAGTWSAWIRADTFANDGAFARTFLYQGDNTGAHEIRLHLHPTSVVYWYGYGAADYVWGPFSSGALSTNTWYHVVGTYNGSSANLYINGHLVNSGSQTGPVGTALSPFCIGEICGITGNPDIGHFSGTIDDVRIYNRALSATEVAALYKSGNANPAHSNSGPNAPLTSGLVGHWTFDGDDTNWATGRTNDISGNGNTGTLVAMSTTTSPTQGKIGQALWFNSPNSTQRVSLATAPTTGLPSTISMWIYPVPSSNFGPLYARSGSGLGLFYDGNARKIYDDDDYNNTPITPNRWHLVTRTVDNAGSRIFYLDGMADGTGFTDIGFIAQEIGGNNFSEMFEGKIDDVRVYNRALSPQEVQQLYKLGAANVAHTNTGPNAPLTSGLVGHWTFDGPATHWETGKTDDKSGQGNNGQLINMSTTSSGVAGKIGQALKFNGSNTTVDIGNVSTLDMGTSDWTSSAWVKTTNNSITPWLVGKIGTTGGGNPDAWSMGLRPSGHLDCLIFDNFAFGPAVRSTDDGVAVNDNKWHHIVCVWNRAGTVDRYVDGALTGTKDSISVFSGKNVASTNKFLLGDRNDLDSPYNGTMDDVRIYNRALSPQEVQQLYLMGK